MMLHVARDGQYFWYVDLKYVFEIQNKILYYVFHGLLVKYI